MPQASRSGSIQSNPFPLHSGILPGNAAEWLHTFHKIIKRSCDAVNFTPISYDYCDNSFILNEMIAQDIGVAFLPQLTWLHSDNPNIVLIRVPELNIIRYINISWNNSLYLSQNARAFIAYAQEYFSSLQEALASNDK